MKTVVVASRQSLAKLYARQHGIVRPIVVTPRAPDAVRGWAHVTRVIVLASMVEHAALPALFATIRPACEDIVELRIIGAALSLDQAIRLRDAWDATA